jgi:uncharacterized membrane protein YozB (DUF420 family)
MFHLLTSDAGIQIIYIWLAILFGVQFGNKILTYRLAKRGLVLPHESRLVFGALSELLFVFVFLIYTGVTGAKPVLYRPVWTPIVRFVFFLILWPESVYTISLTLAVFRLMWRNRRKTQ